MLSFVLVAATPAAAAAQGLPTAQPNLITIVREEVKVGRAAEHQKIEAGWPAAYEKAKSTDYYLALVSMTGPNEAWYVTPYESYTSRGNSMKREDADAALTAELARLSRVDSDVLNGLRVMEARGRRDLSYGAYPDIAKARFVEAMWFRVRPGHEPQFEAASRAYAAAAKRAGAKASYRVYEVIAGAPGPLYLILSSVEAFAEFDQGLADEERIMKGASPDEMAALQKLMVEGIINTETQRFRVDPVQSYVPAATRATDPAFWMPKKPAPPKPTPQP
jgi:hypothetical protein